MRKIRLLLIMMIALLLFVAGEPAETAKAAKAAGQKVAVVELPHNLNFYLDPQNEYGRGQIYSDKYRIHNAGASPVEFSMSILLSVADPEADILFCPQMWEEEPEQRSVYMYALLEGSNGTKEVVLTGGTSCQNSVVLEPDGTDGDTLSISFSGFLSQSEEWKSGEMAVNAVYSMPGSGSAGDAARIVGSHIRLENSADSGEFYLIPDVGYVLPTEISVYVDGEKTDVGYDAVTGRVDLEYLAGDIVVYASGITNAGLPDDTVINGEKEVWTWNAQRGVQAYEYSFFQGNEAVRQGRVAVESGYVNWNWSEGLENGTYRLCLKAIGDTIYCLNSEEGYYQVTVNRTEEQIAETEPENEGGMTVVKPEKPDGTQSDKSEGKDRTEKDKAESADGREETKPEGGNSAQPDKPGDSSGTKVDQPEEKDSVKPDEPGDSGDTKADQPEEKDSIPSNKPEDPGNTKVDKPGDTGGAETLQPGSGDNTKSDADKAVDSGGAETVQPEGKDGSGSDGEAVANAAQLDSGGVSVDAAITGSVK